MSGWLTAQRKDSDMNLPVKLTQKQIALVDTLVAEGCSVKDAAHKAGYAVGESG